MRGQNKTFYHFIIKDKDTDETKYFRTCKEICEAYGVCRATIYNIMNGKHKPRYYENLHIERRYIPI